MKNIYLKIIIILAFVMLLSTFSAQLNAQPLPPSSGHGQNSNQPAGAPLDGGFSIILVLCGIYGISRTNFKINIIKKNSISLLKKRRVK